MFPLFGKASSSRIKNRLLCGFLTLRNEGFFSSIACQALGPVNSGIDQDVRLLSEFLPESV